MRRISILLILLSLLTSEGYSQTDSSFKNRIDSILLSRRFEKVKKIKVAKNGYNVRYFYSKSNNQLDMIQVTEKIEEERWILNYYFVNNEFVKLNKWNNRLPKDPKRAVSNYYFTSNKLVFSEENNTRVTDMNEQLQRIMTLKSSSPRYL